MACRTNRLDPPPFDDETCGEAPFWQMARLCGRWRLSAALRGDGCFMPAEVLPGIVPG